MRPAPAPGGLEWQEFLATLSPRERLGIRLGLGEVGADEEAGPLSEANRHQLRRRALVKLLRYFAGA